MRKGVDRVPLLRQKVAAKPPDPMYEAFVFHVLAETEKLGYLLHMMKQVL